MVVKTAISLPENVFKRVNKEARKRKMSRSRLITTLLEEHWSKLDQQKLRAEIQSAYANHELTKDETNVMDAMLGLYVEDVVDKEEKW